MVASCFARQRAILPGSATKGFKRQQYAAIQAPVDAVNRAIRGTGASRRTRRVERGDRTPAHFIGIPIFAGAPGASAPPSGEIAMMTEAGAWREIYEGGSVAAEARIFRTLLDEMLPAGAVEAPPWLIHAKTVAGIANAEMVVDRDLPGDLAVAHFAPGARLPLMIRFSNASPVSLADYVPDLRGVAMRLALPSGGTHDLLLASHPVSPARDARQFLEIAATAIPNREARLARLAARLGEAEGRRIAAILKGHFKLCSSLAVRHYWSEGAFLWGAAPVRFELHPMAFEPAPGGESRAGNDSLRHELAARLALGDLCFRFAVQRFVDERSTPIEDASVDWSPVLSPPIEIATIMLPRQQLLGEEGRKALRLAGEMRFDPWNAPADFRPLGSLNRLRRLAYAERRRHPPE